MKSSPKERASDLAMKCWKRMKTLAVATAGSKVEAYHTIGEYLNMASPSVRAKSYEEYIVSTFTTRWEALGGFPLSMASAKHARQFARAFDHRQLKKAVKAGFTWSRLRELSRNTVSRKQRRDVVEEALKRKRLQEKLARASAGSR